MTNPASRLPAQLIPAQGLVPGGATAFPGHVSSLGDFRSTRVKLDEGVKTYHLPSWKEGSEPARMKALREIATTAGRDPRLATLAVRIVRGDSDVWAPRQVTGALPRDTRTQAELLLAWVQGLYYVNEPGERLQDPLYTVQVGYGDCDDLALVLAAILESLRIPWRFVLSGKLSGKRGRTIRWVEGTKTKNAQWAHIYVAIGDRPFRPKRWWWAEPTVRGVPLGWDVVGATNATGRVVLPELAGVDVDGEGGVPGAGQAFLPYVWAETKRRLHPRSMVPLLLAGLVSGYLADGLRRRIEGA